MQHFPMSSGPVTSEVVLRASGLPRCVNSGDGARGEPGDEC